MKTDFGWISIPEIFYALNNTFLLVCAILVLFMQVGFAMLESGFNARRNAVNILYKNLLDLSVGGILFYLIGFQLLGPESALWGTIPIPASIDSQSHIGTPNYARINPNVFLLFQMAFAATATTIVSGAVAGRMRFKAYLLYSALLTGFVYPVAAFWAWSDREGASGWLSDLGFHDFAGSVVVHAVGGAAGLAGAILLGPRIDKAFDPRAREVKGHNYVYAALGVFMLWVGWYGFNSGSMLDFIGVNAVEPVVFDGISRKLNRTDLTMQIAINTTLSPMAGAFVGMLLGRVWRGNYDLSMALNGVLAGLVSITASCNVISTWKSLVIGGVAGLVLVLGTALLDFLKIDDPVGAVPVHGLCGIWGGLTPAIFGGHPLWPQLVGVVVLPLWAFLAIWVLFSTLRWFGQLRVSQEDELRGLDLVEHEMEAYNE